MNDEKMEKAVFKLFEMTHRDELHWESKSAPTLWSAATDHVFPFYFETTYQGRRLALFLRRQPAEVRGAAALARAAGAYFDDQYRWAEFTRLAMLGDHDEILFEFPPSRQIKGLFDAVRYKAANVEDFLDELLDSESVDVKQ